MKGSSPKAPAIRMRIIYQRASVSRNKAKSLLLKEFLRNSAFGMVWLL
jgi:hypothetical protein